MKSTLCGMLAGVILSVSSFSQDLLDFSKPFNSPLYESVPISLDVKDAEISEKDVRFCVENQRFIVQKKGKDMNSTLSYNGRFHCFQSDRLGNLEIYLEDILTQRLYNISNNGAIDCDSDLSGEGNRVVYKSFIYLDTSFPNLNISPTKLMITDINEGKVYELMNANTSFKTDFSISRDGEKIVFIERNPNQITLAKFVTPDVLKKNSDEIYLYVLDMQNKKLLKIAQNVAPTGDEVIRMNRIYNVDSDNVKISPDGNNIVFRNRDGVFVINIENIERSTVTKIYDFEPKSNYMSCLDISDGSLVAFDEGKSLVVIDLLKKKPMFFGEYQGSPSLYIEDVALSDDGKTIVFCTRDAKISEKFGGVYKIPLDKKEIERVLETGHEFGTGKTRLVEVHIYDAEGNQIRNEQTVKSESTTKSEDDTTFKGDRTDKTKGASGGIRGGRGVSIDAEGKIKSTSELEVTGSVNTGITRTHSEGQTQSVTYHKSNGETFTTVFDASGDPYKKGVKSEEMKEKVDDIIGVSISGDGRIVLVNYVAVCEGNKIFGFKSFSDSFEDLVTRWILDMKEKDNERKRLMEILLRLNDVFK